MPDDNSARNAQNCLKFSVLFSVGEEGVVFQMGEDSILLGNEEKIAEALFSASLSVLSGRDDRPG